MQVDDHFYKKIIIWDEVHFWLDGFVNKENCRIWKSDQPKAMHETQL